VAASPIPDLDCRSTSASRSTIRATPLSPSSSAVAKNGPWISLGQMRNCCAMANVCIPWRFIYSALRTFSSHIVNQVPERHSADGPRRQVLRRIALLNLPDLGDRLVQPLGGGKRVQPQHQRCAV